MLLKLLVRDFANDNHKDTWKKNQGNQHQVEAHQIKTLSSLIFTAMSSLTIVHAAIGLIYYQRY